MPRSSASINAWWQANAIVPTWHGGEPSATKYQRRVEAERLVFIDETWPRTDMAPFRMGAARAQAPRQSPSRPLETMTFLAALRHDRIDAPWFMERPIDGESFRIYVEKVLLPTLRPGDIVVLDNLGSHRSKAVGQLIRSAVLPAKILTQP
ncbi:hypothetical protein ABIB00_007433 [Bradyrhizobium sp. LB14.3]|uniref:transposase n=1 Tax=Bradyrhizobium sp. LB14.3 TaxID=3156328 RepID=UPI00339086AA